MTCTAVSNNGPTRVSLFLFLPRHDSAGDVCRHLRCSCARFGRGEVKDTLGPRSGRNGFVCDNVHGLLARVMVGAIDTEAVEVTVDDAYDL